ncbi:MAG: Fic family protein [Geminicoccaceae bacterium]
MNVQLETPGRLEPCLLEQLPVTITDLIADIAAAAERLEGRLHPRTAASLADLVRLMNCYYSNLIEGHNTTPRDIERALVGDLDAEEERRILQVEARAHIRVQQKIDQLHADAALPEPASVDFIQWLHREFYADAPEAMLLIAGQDHHFRMEPGSFRTLPEHEVTVGRHLPPSSGRVADFMAYFERRYRLKSMGKGARLVAMAAAHHRLNYIHPFADGNGRVSRLISHAMGHAAGIGTHGLWSISRGLARGLESRLEYKQLMDHADISRQGDLDVRGNLSLRALEDFVTWFLRVCLDQLTFMSELFDLDALAGRLRRYVERHDSLRSESAGILEEALLRGEMARGDAQRVTGLKERAARMALGGLIEDGLLGSESPKGPISLRFPAHVVDILFPRLFPEA